MRRFALLLCFILIFPFAKSQTNSLVGLWKGALIKTSNSVQLLEIEIQSEGDSLIAALTVDDWVYYDAEEFSVKQNAEAVEIETPYGLAKLFYDAEYQEMIGTVGDAIPALSIHLKKTVRDLKIPYEREELELNNQGFKFSGDLYLPTQTSQALACIVIVSGRGCNPRGETEELAHFFARQGMAAFAFDERGAENTDFDCEKSTQALEISDLVYILNQLKKHKRIDKSKVGVMTNSAGAWTADGASLQTELAFMLQYVGPSTSIREQQFDGLRAFAEAETFDPDYLAEAVRYTELLYSENITDAQYAELEALLEKAEAHGWMEWLDDSDIPQSKAQFGELWVQRFQFDPTNALLNFKGPMLSMFGEKDPIVPYQIQTARLDSLFKISGKKNYAVKVVQNGTHGLNQDSEARAFRYNESINSSPYYFKFYRAGVFPLLFATDFLKEYGFLEE